jgi:diguanylate cyclase (GGDEF)-like protein/putative nucleotidyltransferase with HDIG domain
MLSPRPWTLLPPQGSAPPSTEKTPRILVLEGAERFAPRVEQALEGTGYKIMSGLGADHPARTVKETRPDLLLIDMSLSDPSGFELCSELRATETGRAPTIILVSSIPVDDDQVARGLMCGADDFLIIDGRVGEFRARVRVQLRNKRERDRLRRVSKERDAYRRDAVLDSLTGVSNRRSVDRALERLLARGGFFGVLFVDVDHFKRINDTFGHDCGDQVLRAVAATLRESVSVEDFCGRYGGEEFVVALPGAGIVEAESVGERLRSKMERTAMPFEGTVTVSVGVAVNDPSRPDPDVETLLGRADAALYQAKRTGRNRVVRASLDARKVSKQMKAQRPEDGLGEIEALLVKELATGRAGLPLLPEAARQALHLAEDPRTNMVDIATLVERDPPLAARFVALAGSAAYSRGAKISSMQAALVRIGLALARDLLFQVVCEQSTARLPRYQAEVARSFQRSVRAAIASRAIARVLRLSDGHAYLWGLLHDIGEARIYRILARMKTALEPGPALDGLVLRHHARAGADVARAWNLPSEIIDVCTRHHDDVTNMASHVRVVRAADEVVRLFDKRMSEEQPAKAPATELEMRLTASESNPEEHPHSQTRVVAADLCAPPSWREADVPTLFLTGATPEQVALILQDSARYMAEEPTAQEPAKVASR